MSEGHEHGGHEHGAGHEHGHGHGHGHGISRSAANRKRLTAALILTAIYMVAEVIGGLLTHSLALLADAGHMLSDVAALGLSMFAVWIAQHPPTPQRTFGYYRMEILAALANGATLVAITIYIFIEAAERISAPPEVHGGLVMGIAAGGCVMNLLGMWILEGGRDESLNVRGAWVHLMTDMLGNLGTVVAGGLIWFAGWNLADPIASVLIGVLVIYSSWSLLKESVGILLESTPGHIDLDELRNVLAAAGGVREVHDLHVWTITNGMVVLSGHVVCEQAGDEQTRLEQMTDVLRERFGITHSTIQLERSPCDEVRHSP